MYRLVPNSVRTDLEERRFLHHDLSDLPTAALSAEQRLVELALAKRIAFGHRPRLVSVWPTLADDQAWLVQRLRYLQGELMRRDASRDE